MAKPVARVGDTMTHGATILTGSSSRTVDGKMVARIGDNVKCPAHGVNPLVAGGSSVMLDGRAVAVVGSTAHCGAVVLTGSSTTSAG